MAKLKFKQLDTISSMITSAVNAYIKAGKTKDIASYDTDQITHDLYQQGKFTKKSLGLFKSEVPGQAGIDRANKFLAEIQGKSELDVIRSAFEYADNNPGTRFASILDACISESEKINPKLAQQVRDEAADLVRLVSMHG